MSDAPYKPDLVDDAPRNVNYSALGTSQAITTIGLVAAKMLHEHRIVTLMINQEGVLELVPAGELELDALGESAALRALVDRGYTDQQLESYLKQREARLAYKAQPSPG